MNVKKKEKKNKKMISVGEKSTKDIKIKKTVEKKFLKKKKNSDTMMFNVVGVKNSNTVIFIKYHIDDTMTISSNFTKFSLNSKIFQRKKARRRRRKKNKKISKKNESFEKTKKKMTNE